MKIPCEPCFVQRVGHIVPTFLVTLLAYCRPREGVQGFLACHDVVGGFDVYFLCITLGYADALKHTERVDEAKLRTSCCLGSRQGKDLLSAYGLCHLGDYEATVFSPYSHNRQFGESFIRHQDYHRLAEGYYTVEALMVLSERYQVELPICRAVHAILYENADPREQLTELLRRGLRAEFDD